MKSRPAIACPVYSDWPCDDVNCNRQRVCGRIALAKRRMMAHDAKRAPARRFAWGDDYNLAERRQSCRT
jgi:hypothetical protein